MKPKTISFIFAVIIADIFYCNNRLGENHKKHLYCEISYIII